MRNELVKQNAADMESITAKGKVIKVSIACWHIGYRLDKPFTLDKDDAEGKFTRSWNRLAGACTALRKGEYGEGILCFAIVLFGKDDDIHV
jgi:hypothetical protein